MKKTKNSLNHGVHCNNTTKSWAGWAGWAGRTRQTIYECVCMSEEMGGVLHTRSYKGMCVNTVPTGPHPTETQSYQTLQPGPDMRNRSAHGPEGVAQC